MEQTKGVLFEAIMLESLRMFEPVIRLEKIAGCLIGWNFGGTVTLNTSAEAISQKTYESMTKLLSSMFTLSAIYLREYRGWMNHFVRWIREVITYQNSLSLGYCLSGRSQTVPKKVFWRAYNCSICRDLCLHKILLTLCSILIFSYANWKTEAILVLHYFLHFLTHLCLISKKPTFRRYRILYSFGID